MPACGSKFVSGSSNCSKVLGVLGWALTRIRNSSLVLHCLHKRCQQWLCVEQSCGLYTNIRGRGRASNVSYPLYHTIDKL